MLEKRGTAIYLFSHGFGFTNRYWDNFIQFLHSEDRVPKPIAYDFWKENFKYEEGKEYVGIGHSVGFLKLNNFKQENPKINFKALIGLGGFLNFCGTDHKKRDVRLNNLNKMINIFSKDTESALRFFYKICGYSEAGYFVTPHVSKSRLISDLELMKCNFKHCSVPTLIIGSDDDAVVEYDVLLDNFCNNTRIRQKNSEQSLIQLDCINGVKHMLGFYKPGEVFDRIIHFLART